MRLLFAFGRRGPASDFAGSSRHKGNGAGVEHQEVMATRRARPFSFRGCAWGEGYTRFGNAIRSNGWLR